MTRPQAAATFWLDVNYSDVAQVLTRAGIRPVLLKGPALDLLLYGGRRTRAYSDVDLLVDPARLPAAERCLYDVGFRRFEPESTVRQTDPEVGVAVGVLGASHATSWVRENDNFTVDLHDSLPQVGAPTRVCWQLLQQHITAIRVVGVPCETLDHVASALLIALHAAHHGPIWSSGRRDLERALTILDVDCWRAAAELARLLNAEVPMGVGLGLVKPGRALAAELGLSIEPTRAHHLLWAGAPWTANVIEALLAQQSAGARLRLLAAIIKPSPDAMRRGSSRARKGTLGLLSAYAARSLRLARHIGPALRARRRGDRSR